MAPYAGQAVGPVDPTQMGPEATLLNAKPFGTMNDRRRQKKNRLGGGLSDQAAAAFLSG